MNNLDCDNIPMRKINALMNSMHSRIGAVTDMRGGYQILKNQASSLSDNGGLPSNVLQYNHSRVVGQKLNFAVYSLRIVFYTHMKVCT